MKIYIIRHGETDWNAVRRLQGHSDICLNAYGIELAEITARALADVPFSRIYTSPLIRARQTAEIIKGDRQIPVITEERVKEIGFGIYEGYCYDKDNYNIPDPAFIYFFKAPEKYIPPEGGESLEKLCRRTTDFLKELIHNKELEEETVLISTHGAALRGLLSSVNMNGLAEFWEGGVHKNCAVTILNVRNSEIEILEEGKVFYKE